MVDVAEDSNYDYSVDNMVAEIVKGKAYLYPAQKPAKGKEKEEAENKDEYSFDISKANQIFDYLCKDKPIKLLDVHKIPLLRK